MSSYPPVVHLYICAQMYSKTGNIHVQEIFAKALNGIQWEVAHLLTLNYEVPIFSMDFVI